AVEGRVALGGAESPDLSPGVQVQQQLDRRDEEREEAERHVEQRVVLVVAKQSGATVAAEGPAVRLVDHPDQAPVVLMDGRVRCRCRATEFAHEWLSVFANRRGARHCGRGEWGTARWYAYAERLGR